jgi:archaellum component FlaC
MSEEKLGFVGKQVKDIYGTYIGKVVGIITEIDGEIETVGVDCGSGGLKQLPYEQLVIQGDYVFFIPKWRLDAQRLLRQKSLTLKRIKALQDIVAENDSMKEDAELVYLKYEKKLVEIEGGEKQVNDRLSARLAELDAETKSIKAVLFDAKLQFRSNEMKEETYQQIKVQTDELIEHITNEKTEIGNVKAKLAANTLENIASVTTPAATPAKEEAPVAEPSQPSVEAPAQQVTASGAEEEKPVAVSANGEQAQSETSWLNQVITK